MEPGINSNQKLDGQGGNGIVVDATISPDLHHYSHCDERYMRSQTPCAVGNQRYTTTPSLTVWQTQGRIRKPTNTRVTDICGQIPMGQSWWLSRRLSRENVKRGDLCDIFWIGFISVNFTSCDWTFNALASTHSKAPSVITNNNNSLLIRVIGLTGIAITKDTRVLL